MNSIHLGPLFKCFDFISFVRYCVCYIHEEFNCLLYVLRKDSLLAHENCDCDCAFCYDGNCKQVFDSEMDLYWCMRHMLCKPSKLHSKTAQNLFPPRYVSIVCGLYIYTLGKQSIPLHYPVQLLGGALLFRYFLFFWASIYHFSVPKIQTILWTRQHNFQAVC